MQLRFSAILPTSIFSPNRRISLLRLQIWHELFGRNIVRSIFLFFIKNLQVHRPD